MQLNRKSIPQLIYWDVVDNLKYYSGVPEGNQLTTGFIDQFLQRVKEDKIEPIGNPPSIETRIEEVIASFIALLRCLSAKLTLPPSPWFLPQMIYFFARHCYPFAWFLGLCMKYPVGVVVFFGMVSFLVVVLTVAFICLEAPLALDSCAGPLLSRSAQDFERRSSMARAFQVEVLEPRISFVFEQGR